MKRMRWIILVGLILLVITAVSGQSAQAHGGITVNGAFADWCFTTLLPATDTRASLNPGSGCTQGNEVIWEDAAADGNGLAASFARLVTTADPTTLFFAASLHASVGGPFHFQIAIDVQPGVGNTVWFDPGGALGAGNSVGATTGVAADYLIVIEPAGPSAEAHLYQATTTPGSWTLTPTIVTFVRNGTDVEISIPWGGFGAGACGSCPAFAPGTTANMMMMMTTGTSNNGQPTSPIIDTFSEVTAHTHTLTTQNCPSGAGATACEMGDNSADAYITVTYDSPTAVSLRDISANPTTSWVTLALVGALAIGSVTLLRRRPLLPVPADK